MNVILVYTNFSGLDTTSALEKLHNVSGVWKLLPFPKLHYLPTYLHLNALIFIFYKSAVVKSRLLQGGIQHIAKSIRDKLFIDYQMLVWSYIYTFRLIFFSEYRSVLTLFQINIQCLVTHDNWLRVLLSIQNWSTLPELEPACYLVNVTWGSRISRCGQLWSRLGYINTVQTAPRSQALAAAYFCPDGVTTRAGLDEKTNLQTVHDNDFLNVYTVFVKDKTKLS